MINAIVSIHKEAGYTSHDVVAKLRGILKQKKIGHTGTLDPDATGVLPVCLGKATKLCSRISDWDKTYEATLLLGQTTDTEDTSGTIRTASPVKIRAEAVPALFQEFLGDYDQIPPMYSAKKVNGKKLYDLAREGVTIERPPCRVHIDSIDILEVALPFVRFRVTCSKGTYIRSLCRDIGEKAGCGGCMAELVRTRVADFTLEKSRTLGEIERMQREGSLAACLYPIDSVFFHYPALAAKPDIKKALYNGHALSFSSCRPIRDAGERGETAASDSFYRIYDDSHQFIGIYKADEERALLRPDTFFFDAT